MTIYNLRAVSHASFVFAGAQSNFLETFQMGRFQNSRSLKISPQQKVREQDTGKVFLIEKGAVEVKEWASNPAKSEWSARCFYKCHVWVDSSLKNRPDELTFQMS